MAKENNNKDDSPKKQSNNSSVQKSNNSISDFKLTLITNTVLIGIIAYLFYQLKVDRTFADCGEYFSNGYRQNGIYEVKPLRDSNERINVYCNMTAGGWTSIMSRNTMIKNQIEWQLKLSNYKTGFGQLDGEHFLGLDNINMLTTAKDRQLMIVLNETQYRIKHFRVLNEYYNYKLIVDKEIDKMPDDSSFLRLNNTFFSTIDVDFDLAVNSNCSSGWKAGWWFTDCFDKSTCLTCLIMHGTHGVKRLHYAGMLIK